jgi:peptidyl-dipeptidase A
LFADDAEFERLRGWYEGREGLDSLTKRQVEVLFRAYAARRGDRTVLRKIQELEAQVNAVFGNHRSVVGGREVGENEVRSILRSSDDEPRRREAWEASKTVGREVEGTVRELARLRNSLARDAGYPDHYHRSLDLQEIDAGELSLLMEDLRAATGGPFRELRADMDAEIRSRFGVEDVRPWHMPDPFFQEPPEDGEFDVDRYFAGRDLEALTRITYDNMGLEVRDVMARSDLYEREGKSQHAFCLGVGRDYPYDVRVLANLRAGAPDAYWASTMLHEFGHAVYDKHINPNLPFLLRSIAHTCTTEAIALMMDGLSEDPAWLRSVARVPQGEIDVDRLSTRRASRGLVFTRWALVMFHFEQALYADPDREDLNRVWWDLVEDLQLVSRPPGREEPDWAAKIHVGVAPIYYHNYVLGHLMAAQLRHYLEAYVANGSFCGSEVSGRYLQEAVFGSGARDDWQTTVVRATGEPLNPDYFVKTLL